MCDAIYVGNTQQMLKKRTHVHLFNILHLFRIGHKSDSFSAHFEQNFHATMSRTYLRKYITFKVVKQINPIGAMKNITKPKCNLCIE